MGEQEMSADMHDRAGRPPTLAEIRQQWPPTIDVERAGAAFGISRSHAYALIARGEFPASVIKVGERYRVITESIINALSDEVVP
jgi:predicted DNA-binding transcriptional regulator AlpA